MRFILKNFPLVTILFLLAFSCYSQEPVHCLVKTSLGDIGIELYPGKAPLTVKNFMAYVDKGLYDESSFFRVCNQINEAGRELRIEVIQGGNVSEDNLFDPIPIESTRQTGIKHKNGIISMARDTPNSARSSFFICINDQPELDFGGKRNPDGQGFAAFGKVTKGMEIVKKIQKLEDKGQYLVNPVIIYTIQRID